MYESVRIENFRAFRSLELRQLTRVNLLVGKNNAGKTSILEAIELLALGGRPTSLFRSPRRRGELAIGADEERTRTELDMRHIFHGHLVQDGAALRVTGMSSAGEDVVECQVRPALEPEGQVALFPEEAEGERRLALHISGVDNSQGTSIPIFASGTLGVDYRRLASNVSAAFAMTPGSVVFLGTEGAEPLALQQMWDGLVLTPEEARVIEAIRIIEPSVERLAFAAREYRQSTVAFVKLLGADQRVPLGSFGDGMRRILALAIFVAKAGGGILLVDEIDTGLHHSALESMWRFVVESARRLGVQVFATSHSGDCVRSLAWLHGELPELADDVSVHRVDRDLGCATRYSAAEIEVAARHHMEIRG